MKKDYNNNYEDYFYAQNSKDINVLINLSLNKDKEVRKLVILNKNTPPEILRDMAYNETKKSNLKLLALNPRILLETFEYLIHKEDVIVDEVIENINVPISILEKLKMHHCSIIRENSQEKILELESERPIKVQEVKKINTFFKVIEAINSFLVKNREKEELNYDKIY